MTEQKLDGFANDLRPVFIAQQPKTEDQPSQAAKAAPETETKDLAPTEKPERHHRHPTPETAAITKKYSVELPSTDRHGRKCQICHHPDRASIEEDFILWCTPRSISVEYRVPEMALYRHARAFDLFTIRRESLRLSLDRVLERGPEAPVTAGTIIRAVKAQACLTDDNHWIDPAKHFVFSTNPPPDQFSGNRNLSTDQAGFTSDTSDRGKGASRGEFLIDSPPIRNEG
jgi:hypothetical protein